MNARMTKRQIRLWHNERGWIITINAELSRTIHNNSLTHADFMEVNGKHFITFSKPTIKTKRNVSTNAKGKTACNAYIRLQTLITPFVSRLKLTEREYYLTLANNTSRQPDRLTFEILSLDNAIEEKPVSKGRMIDEDTYQALRRLGILDTSVRSYNRGTSDYSQHIIQPWSIWQDYQLNPFDADIVKRILRHKQGDSRRLDYEKIIHICEERIRQLEYEQE